MSVVKIIELISEGDTLEKAIKSAVEEASKTIKHIKQLDVQHIQAIIDETKVTKFRVNAKVSFLIEK